MDCRTPSVFFAASLVASDSPLGTEALLVNTSPMLVGEIPQGITGEPSQASSTAKSSHPRLPTGSSMAITPTPIGRVASGMIAGRVVGESSQASFDPAPCSFPPVATDPSPGAASSTIRSVSPGSGSCCAPCAGSAMQWSQTAVGSTPCLPFGIGTWCSTP
ncbi:hypothetical protein B0T25DRAFT_289254 [Lasiosphaeria hispida]|uniref:Uncharacterized protein n=1 Tax=Lasiosphaeria hispida TaxID=260671 RepID=A0AAJ0MBF9_9PEZI|nr:hypothetical protein B0T25DRAFT_289254 [Lasiosphaeria hispida]